MRKDIRNIDPVIPIVHKPRISNHKTFGENVVHGDFTFNNKDYLEANKLVRIFGHSKFIRMFWRLFFPMLIWGVITALVPILFDTMAKGYYHALGDTIYLSFSYTLGKFSYINIFVALAWVLMAYPIVGNYIGRNQPAKIQEAVRFVFYILIITSTIAMVCELIYAPLISQQIVWKYSNISDYNLSVLVHQHTNGQFASLNQMKVYFTDVQRGFQLRYSSICIRYFAFTSYLVGWASIYTPMFASRRNNKVLIISTVLGLVFFIVVYSSCLYTSNLPQDNHYIYTVGTEKIVTSETTYIPYNIYVLFEPLINQSCGIYIGYNAVIPVSLFVFTLFPRFFKSKSLAVSNYFKNLYNRMVDKQSDIEFKISQIRYKKFKLENKISSLQNLITDLTNIKKDRLTNNYYSEEKIAKINAKIDRKISHYKDILENNTPAWQEKISQYNKQIISLQEKFEKTPSTNKKLFYIDYEAMENIDTYERNFLWFSGNNVPLRINRFKYFLINTLKCPFWDSRNVQWISLRVSKNCMKNVWTTSGGAFINQFAYGVFGLTLVIFATNFNGNLLGIPGSTLEGGKEYYKTIVANASLISGYLGWVYNGFVLLPQYFVAYYLGKNDKETAYHNSLFLMNWSFVVGFVLCCIVLIYGAFINQLLYPSDGHTYIPFKLTGGVEITWTQFYQDCFYMELILAIVEIFDAATTLGFNILVAGGSKWTFFSDQFIRLINIAALITLYYSTSSQIHWFNYMFSANIFIYYLIGRSHSVVPAFISWIFIERGLALRTVEKEDNKEILPNILDKKDIQIHVNNKLDKKTEIVVA